MPPFVQYARYRDIASDIARRLAEGRGTDALAPWAEEVIVPSRGVADAIAGELLARVPSGIAGLQLQTLETLARRILNDAGEYPRVASAEERRLAMRVASRSITDPMMESRGIAAMLERSYRDVRDGGLTLDELRARARTHRARLRNLGRTRTLVRVWSEYERLIAQMGTIDPADLLRRAAARGRAAAAGEGARAPFILAGFYDMTGVQLALADAIDQAGLLAAVYIPAGAEDAYRFAQPLVRRFGAPPALHEKETRVTVAELETRHAEIADVCRRVGELLAEGVRASDIGIVARTVDPYDARLVARFAAEHGFATTFTAELPLVAQRIGRGVASLLRLRERGFPRAEVLELVRDGFRARTHIHPDRADAATREARIAGGPSDDLRRIRNRKFEVDDYIALVAEVEGLTKKTEGLMRGAEWHEYLQHLLGRFRLETDDDLAAAASLDEVAELFRIADRMALKLDAAHVLDAIEQSCVGQRTTDNGQPAVFFGDVMRFRGRSFEHLFAIRMQDDLFPQRRVEDPLVPDSDRRLVGLREIGTGRDEEQLLFQLLHDASASLRFSFAGTDGFGKPLRRSTLLRGFAVERELTVDGSRLTGPPARRQLQLIALSGTRSVFDGFLPPSVAASTLASVTPTQLEDFGECPQKFLLKHVLGVRDVDDPERELQIHHRDKGSIDHRILEEFYRALDRDELLSAQAELPLLTTVLAKRLEAAVDREFDRLEQDAPPFNRTVRAIERRATKRILRDFVAADLADLAANDLVPQHFEYRFGKPRRDGRPADHPEAFVIAAGGVPIRVEGQIDRIDAGGGKFRIVDYKSGKALRHHNLAKKIDRGVRLQLALYAMAVAEFFGAEASDVSGTIKPLVMEARPATFAFLLDDKGVGLGETLDIFVRAILAGRFPAFPNEKDDDFNSCKYCPVSHSCRTKHDGEEKYAVTRSGEPRTLLQELA